MSINLLTVKEGAALARVKPQTLYMLINQPGSKVPVYKLGKKLFRIDKELFEEWIKNQGKGGGE